MISVVIPFVQRCRNTVSGNRLSPLPDNKTPLEILVIDDHSTDDTMEKMGRYGEMTGYGISGMRQTKEHPHPETAVYSLAKGDYIAFLDADDYWDPEKLEKQEKPLQRPVMCSAVRVGS